MLLPSIRWPLTRMRPWRRNADAAAIFEHVDSTLLDSAGFRASDSIGLDGAPSMVFRNAMPPYSRDIDRPAESTGVAPK